MYDEAIAKLDAADREMIDWIIRRSNERLSALGMSNVSPVAKEAWELLQRGTGT